MRKVLSFEKFPVRGFQSSMEIPLHVGLGEKSEVDSMVVIWPDNRYQVLKSTELMDSLALTYKKNLPLFDYHAFKQKREDKGYKFEDIA
ncbi:MAG: hypothetical protein EOO46_22005, partial [Flavobacterium sp.]